jgi:hypothetical protein
MSEEETPIIKLFYDMRMIISVGSAIVSAVIAVLMVLHSLGILTYETRLSVIETKMDEIYRSMSRIDHNVDDISKAIFKRN